MKPYSIRSSASALVLGAALVSVLPLAAQEDGAFHVSTGFGYRTDADIDHDGGDFNETRFGVTANRPFNYDERWRLDPIVAYRFSSYDFSGPELWDEVHQFRATLMLRHVINEKWAVFGGPTVALAMESSADAGEALTFGGTLGVTYHVHERLTIGGGLGVITELEDNPTFRPVVLLNWRIHDQWTLESGYFEAAGSGGPGVEIRYQINEHWNVGAGAQYQENRFRLSEDGPVRDGVGEDSFVPVYGKVTWRINKQAALELLGGVSLGGELRVENRKGHTVSKDDYDPAALLGLRALLSF